MSHTTTFLHAGTLGGPDGELSVSFMPEFSAIFLHATVPSDKRRLAISIRLSDTATLREIVDKLEDVINSEAKRRAAPREGEGLARIQNGGDSVSVEVTGTRISLPRALYEQAAQLVASGKAMLAASAISKSLPWLGASGAKEIIQAIYEHQRLRGERE